MPLLLIVLILCVPSFASSATVVDVPKQILPGMPVVATVKTVELGVDTSRGVRAQVQLRSQPLLDIKEPLDRSLQHFLISVVFTDIRTKKEIREGEVATRIFDSRSGRKTKTTRLELQDQRWTGLLVLPTEGETLIKLGSKLADGKKRIYRFFYNQNPTAPSL